MNRENKNDTNRPLHIIFIDQNAVYEIIKRKTKHFYC